MLRKLFSVGVSYLLLSLSCPVTSSSADVDTDNANSRTNTSFQNAKNLEERYLKHHNPTNKRQERKKAATAAIANEGVTDDTSNNGGSILDAIQKRNHKIESLREKKTKRKEHKKNARRQHGKSDKGSPSSSVRSKSDKSSRGTKPVQGGAADLSVGDGITYSGELTRWIPGDVTLGKCEYAKAPSIAKSDAWLSPYITGGNYCAASADLFKDGAGCGRCYKVSYDGSSATNPGKAGNAVVQIVDLVGDGSNHLDCFLGGFRVITGSKTGIFSTGIQLTHVKCQNTVSATAVILDGNNASYVKVLFAGGTTGVTSANIIIGSKTFQMTRESGATFFADTPNAKGQASFEVFYGPSTKVIIDNGCFGGHWPVATSSVCA